MIALFVAPLAVLTGLFLSRVITDEILLYDKEFFFFSAGLLLLSVLFTTNFVLAILLVLASAAALWFRLVSVLGISVGLLLLVLSVTGAQLVLVSFIAATAYLYRHEQATSLWVLASIPTLISVFFLLL
ncbi:MAG: hypothetical protein ACMXYD_01135 [Candidatus Woesearchaeota archaeon]